MHSSRLIIISKNIKFTIYLASVNEIFLPYYKDRKTKSIVNIVKKFKSCLDYIK